MLTGLLKRLINRGDLERDEMTGAIGAILDGEVTPTLGAGFLVASRLKGETAAELAGAAFALRQRRRPVATSRGPIVDTCGTGGDLSNTFNISTAAALVAAAAGVVVAKQVSGAVSSRAGSADVLLEIGIDLAAADRVGEHYLEDLGIGFFHTQVFHPSLASVELLREELGVRTLFDFIAPLANPAGARRHLVGVFSRDLLWPMAEAFRLLGSDRAWIVHGHDGLDELSVCAPSRIVEWTGDNLEERTLKPEEVGLARHPPEGLHGGTPAENAEIMTEILAGGRPGVLQDAVALNAAAAIFIAGLTDDLVAAVERAKAVLENGTAGALLDRIRGGTKEVSPEASPEP